MSHRILIGAALLVGLSGCQPSASDSAAFGQRVRAYLLAHPEVIQESAARLKAKYDADDAEKMRAGRALIPRLRAAIERDPADFVANPAGRITVTEFYDYRCPHCVNAAPKVLALIHDHPEIRFVFKEMPIFGPTSEYAARAALAVKAAGGDNLAFYRALMTAGPLDAETVGRLARRQGVITVPDANPHLAATTTLFQKLALGGTPAFVIGDEVVYGEDMDAVAAAVARVEAAKTS